MVAYFFAFFVRGGLFRSTPPCPMESGVIGTVSGDAGLVGNLCPGGTGPVFPGAFGAYLLWLLYCTYCTWCCAFEAAERRANLPPGEEQKEEVQKWNGCVWKEGEERTHSTA